MSRPCWALAGLFVALNVADLATTLHALSLGGIELNPAMAIVHQSGPWVFVLIKVSVSALAGVYLAENRRFWLLMGLTLFYGLVVANNVWQLWPLL